MLSLGPRVKTAYAIFWWKETTRSTALAMTLKHDHEHRLQMERDCGTCSTTLSATFNTVPCQGPSELGQGSTFQAWCPALYLAPTLPGPFPRQAPLEIYYTQYYIKLKIDRSALHFDQNLLHEILHTFSRLNFLVLITCMRIKQRDNRF